MIIRTSVKCRWQICVCNVFNGDFNGWMVVYHFRRQIEYSWEDLIFIFKLLNTQLFFFYWFHSFWSPTHYPNQLPPIAIRMLGEQINTHGIGNQGTPPCQNCNTYEQQMKELLTRNAELEKSIKGQNVLEELLSQYAKSQTQNALQKANTEWWAENRDSTFRWKNNVVLLFFMNTLPNKKPNKSVRNSKKKKVSKFQSKNLI